MKLYKVSCNYKYAFGDITETYDGTDFISLSSETIDLLNKFRFDWQTNDSSIIPDITIIVSELLCFDEKAIKILLSLLNGVKFNPILIGDKNFNSLSNIHVLKNVLDLKSSKVKYFSTGDIMEITLPIFKKQKYPNLFRIDEIGGYFFCTEEFKRLIDINNLTGISFEECQVKSKSLFSL